LQQQEEEEETETEEEEETEKEEEAEEGELAPSSGGAAAMAACGDRATPGPPSGGLRPKLIALSSDWHAAESWLDASGTSLPFSPSLSLSLSQTSSSSLFALN
jgi:hypothetical protein